MSLSAQLQHSGSQEPVREPLVTHIATMVSSVNQPLFAPGY